MVSMRYHSLLFAYILKKSIVAIEYQGKCRSLAQEIGLEEGALLSLNDISCNTLLDAINKVLNNTDKCTNRRSVEKSLSMAKEMFSVVGLGSVNRK
jgi:polysaccharide pyruvyl transferase WcaK-like protein